MAVIGLGNMGKNHCRDIAIMETAELTAVCDIDKDKVDEFSKLYNCKGFTSSKELFEASIVDAVLISTPHYFHTTISIEAFKKGIHVLTEKPVGVHVKDVKKMIAAYEMAKKKKPDLKFSAMFQQRTKSAAIKIKDLIDSGELGKLIRMTWIITDWYRTQAYYNSGGWRATWEGEGGGVLMNQCPHQLDMYQWFAGCPDRVMAFASLGKYHDIEVEDEVTAYFEYDNGMVGHFITTTGEAPGTNRLEIVGEQGKLIWENDTLTFHRTRISVFEDLKNSESGFGKPECWVCQIPIDGKGGEQKIIIENFCDSIQGKGELIAQASEGLNSISMDNAIMLSSFEKKMIDIPLDEDAYEAKLIDLIAHSTIKKNITVNRSDDFNSSF
jgi:predicted dehydrogenase